MAQRVGVSKQAVSDQERAVYAPTEANLDALAEVYGTTKKDLRYGEIREPDSLRMAEPPRVSLGLPQPIRIWIQEFLLELVKADVSDREVDEARRVLTAPELSRLLAGGEPGEETEAQILRGLEGFGAAIRDTLRSRGYELAK